MAKTNANYSVLVDVELDTSSIQKQLKNANKNLKVNVDAKGAINGIEDLGSAMDDTNLSFNAANEVFRTTIDVITSMVDQVYELDEALTEFRKVSDLSGQSLEEYTDYLSQLGLTVGRTTSEMLEAATEFRKNGFNDSDAAMLGQIAAMYQNVSDEAISAGDSASFIISQLIAFNMEADDATHIIDAVNETANQFSVSSGELARGLGIVASTSSAMGNSMEQTLGMLTAISEQTRNVNRSARGNGSLSIQ